MPANLLPSVFITPLSKESLGVTARIGTSSAPATATWPSAGRAFYVPFSIPDTITVYRLFVLNGTTAAGANNWDVGVYTSGPNKTPVTRLVSSGATASSGTSVCQFFDIADTVLPGPQMYFMGMSGSGTTDHVFRLNPAILGYYSLAGIFGESAANPLPATATPIPVVNAFCPIFGLALRATP